MKVKLMKDLTQYDPNLKIGAIGIARMDKIIYNDFEQEMVEVKVPNAKALPIGWNALEIIDRQFWKDRARDIKQSYLIEFIQGPRGGFKWLRMYSKNRNGVERIYTTNIKHEALKIVDLAKSNGREVKIIIKG